MNATQPPIVSIETRSKRSHIGRGTLNFCLRASANSASAAAPTMPHRPREDNGGHSVSRCFMIGKLRPHPDRRDGEQDKPERRHTVAPRYCGGGHGGPRSGTGESHLFSF